MPVEALGRPSRKIADRLGCGELNRGGLIDATDPGRLQGGIESLRGVSVRTCRDSSSVRGRTLAGNVRTGATCAMPPRPQLHRTPPRPSAEIQLHSLFPYLSLNLRTDKEPFSLFNCLYEIFYRPRFYDKLRRKLNKFNLMLDLFSCNGIFIQG